MMSMPRLLDHGRWRGLVAVSLLTLLQGMAAGVAAFATRGLFDALNSGQPLLPEFIGLLSGSGLVIAASRVGARLSGERLGQAYALAIRLTLLEHAAGMPASATAARRSGYMSLRFVGDMTAFRNWLGQGLPRLIAGSIMLPAACVVLWWLNPAFCAAVAPIFMIALALLIQAGPRLEQLHRRLRARRAKIAADMAERMPLAPQLDRLGRRPAELRKLRRSTRQMITASMDRVLWSETLKSMSDLVAALAASGIILVGAMTDASIGSIAGALAAVGLIVTPLRDLASVWNFRAAHAAASRKCLAALQRQSRSVYAGQNCLPKGSVAISIRDFGLPSGCRLSQEIRAGSIDVLRCASADADLLFAVLCGLEDLQPDKIMLAGICLTRLSRGSLRRDVHHLVANPLVLKGSLRRNLVLGLSRRPPDEVLEAVALKAGLKCLLQRINGLQGKLAEGGRDLSGTERCRIAVARLLLSRPKLVLFNLPLWYLPGQVRTVLSEHLGSTGATVVQHPAMNAYHKTRPETSAGEIWPESLEAEQGM